jgi:hypothetical protein
MLMVRLTSSGKGLLSNYVAGEDNDGRANTRDDSCGA